MKQTRVYDAKDKRLLFGPGPWCAEPDRVEWESDGLACLLLRHYRFGSWCGYVGVAPGHRMHGIEATSADSMLGEAAPHGGISYGDTSEPAGCRLEGRPDALRLFLGPEHAKADDLWWLGFDAAHGSDVLPNIDCRQKADLLPMRMSPHAVYRDLQYMIRQCEAFSERLAAMPAE